MAVTSSPTQYKKRKRKENWKENGCDDDEDKSSQNKVQSESE